MSGCEMYQELISCLLDGELNEEESTALAAHLEHCPECEAMFEAFTGLSKSISENTEEIPQGLHENIMAAVRREDIKNKNSRKKLSKPIKAVLTTAACAVLVVGAGAAVFPGLFRSKSAAPVNYAMVASDEAEAMPRDGAAAEAAPENQSRMNMENQNLPDEAPAQFSLRNSGGGENNERSEMKTALDERDLNVIALKEENWQKLETFLAENRTAAEISLPEIPDRVISLNDGSLSLNVYFIDDCLYCQTEEGQVFSLTCSAEEFTEFLDNLQ